MGGINRRVGGIVEEWVHFLRMQESPFKVNILKNLAQRFATNLTYQYQPIYLTALGASPLVLGYINSLSGLVNTLLAIPTGIVADRVGIKNILLMTISFSILSSIVFGLSMNWELAAVALVFSAVAYTLDRTVCPMICGSTLTSAERMTGMGICDTISFFPQLIAPIAGAFMITLFGGMNQVGIRPLYYIQIVGLAAAFLIIWTWFENPKTKMAGHKSEGIIHDINEILNEGILAKRWILLTIVSAFPWQVLFYVPLYASQIKGANQYVIGGMSTASTLVFVFLAVPLGHLSDKFGRKKVVTAASLLVSLSYMLLISSTNDIVLLASGFLSGFIMTVIQTQMAISVDLVSPKYLGRWYGILGFSRGLTGIASPIICGYIWAAISPESVFYLLTAMQLSALVMLLSMPKEVTR